MNRDELLTEIRRLNRLLAQAKRKAVAQYGLADKLTAAILRVQMLLRKLTKRRAA